MIVILLASIKMVDASCSMVDSILTLRVDSGRDDGCLEGNNADEDNEDHSMDLRKMSHLANIFQN